jgi:hypothetical protein
VLLPDQGDDSNALDDDGAKVASVESTAERVYQVHDRDDQYVSHFLQKNLHPVFCNANPKVLSSNDAGSVFSNIKGVSES